MKLLKLSIIKQQLIENKKYNLIKIEIKSNYDPQFIGTLIRRNLIRETMKIQSKISY